MYKYLFSFLLLFSFVGSVKSADDAISQRTYEYLKRINEFIDEENYDNAKKEVSKMCDKLLANTVIEDYKIMLNQ